MSYKRIYYDGSTVKGVEHRRDELELGAAAYTADNVPGPYQAYSWIVAEDAELRDAESHYPIEALEVAGGRIAPNAAKLSDMRQKQKDRMPGAGGRLDELHVKLKAGAITDAELRELMRLERGL